MSVKSYPAYRESGVEWIGRLPIDWSVTALKHVVSMQSGEQITAEQITAEGLFPVFGGNGLRGYTSAFTHEGEYALVGRQGALCGNVNYARGRFWASEHAVVVTPKQPCEVRWIGELLRAMDLGQYSVTAAQPGLSVEVIGNLRIPVPTRIEQFAIASFLDREIGKIDALVAEQERLIALLKEKRQVVISHAVTKGLNPNVPMQDSGVEWLGEVPAHWQIVRAKKIFERSDLPYSDDAEVVTCFRDGQVTLRRNRREDGFTVAILEVGYQGIVPGQLVLHSMDAFAGAIGICDSVGKCSPEYIVCTPKNKDVLPNYFGKLLRLMALRGFILAACPSVRERAPRIRFPDFGEMLIPLPPAEEQGAIHHAIEQEGMKLEALQKEAERAITLLRERRAALISAAVTGKIDVRALAAQPEAQAA